MNGRLDTDGHFQEANSTVRENKIKLPLARDYIGEGELKIHFEIATKYMTKQRDADQIIYDELAGMADNWLNKIKELTVVVDAKDAEIQTLKDRLDTACNDHYKSANEWLKEIESLKTSAEKAENKIEILRNQFEVVDGAYSTCCQHREKLQLQLAARPDISKGEANFILQGAKPCNCGKATCPINILYKKFKVIASKKEGG